MVSMMALKQCFLSLGYSHVRTYINSGNIVFQATEENPRAIEERIETALRKTFTLEVRVIVLSETDMANIVQAIPAAWQTTTHKCNVIFLHHSIDTPRIVASFHLQPAIERLQYVPGALLWLADTGALSKSSLVGNNKSLLYQAMTVRNARTARTIYERMRTVNA